MHTYIHAVQTPALLSAPVLPTYVSISEAPQVLRSTLPGLPSGILANAAATAKRKQASKETVQGPSVRTAFLGAAVAPARPRAELFTAIAIPPDGFPQLVGSHFSETPREGERESYRMIKTFLLGSMPIALSCPRQRLRRNTGHSRILHGYWTDLLTYM